MCKALHSRCCSGCVSLSWRMQQPFTQHTSTYHSANQAVPHSPYQAPPFISQLLTHHTKPLHPYLSASLTIPSPSIHISAPHSTLHIPSPSIHISAPHSSLHIPSPSIHISVPHSPCQAPPSISQCLIRHTKHLHSYLSYSLTMPSTSIHISVPHSPYQAPPSTSHYLTHHTKRKLLQPRGNRNGIYLT